MVFESLQRSPQTTVHEFCFLLDRGSGWVRVAVPSVQILSEPG